MEYEIEKSFFKKRMDVFQDDVTNNVNDYENDLLNVSRKFKITSNLATHEQNFNYQETIFYRSEAAKQVIASNVVCKTCKMELKKNMMGEKKHCDFCGYLLCQNCSQKSRIYP